MARTYERPPWRIEITTRPGVEPPVAGDRLADDIRAALDAGRAPSPADVGLVLSDDAELARLNERAMGRPEPTDVLSFPLLPASAFPAHEGQGPDLRQKAPSPDFVLPPGESVHLGEIVVSVERAIAQAEAGRGGQTGDVRWSVAQELRLLVTHGCLHLCGWDHADPVEEAAMRGLERGLLGEGSVG
ncbi:MAG TPA: rRNA maturation RNase YbeY [Candidatus Limnocylindrales bacterium]|nr:rRNA maturation RNase YbeY [Candidatus Limnocylindrales bacterium]